MAFGATCSRARMVLCSATTPGLRLLRPRSLVVRGFGPRHQSTAAATTAAVLDDIAHIPSPKVRVTKSRVIAKDIVASELNHLNKQIKLLLSSGYPGLDMSSKYYLQGDGKYFRPMVIFLMSRATAVAPKYEGWIAKSTGLEETVNKSVAPWDILKDLNPDFGLLSSRTPLTDIRDTPDGPIQTLATQRRLAEITELIHTATLMHDDVIDHAETRRGRPSVNLFCGNKASVLAGDFMLGRASVYLARLREPEVIELLAETIAELVKGELYQLTNTPASYNSPDYLEKSLEHYLSKTYLKAAALISKSARAAAVLGGATPEVAEAAYTYGKNLGIAFQLIDDVLDYEGSDKSLGKPANADLNLGLATAPVFYAWEEHPELGPMIARQFGTEGDAKKATEMVYNSQGLLKTKKLAREKCNIARNAISWFPPSEAKEGLEQLLVDVVTRTK